MRPCELNPKTQNFPLLSHLVPRTGEQVENKTFGAQALSAQLLYAKNILPSREGFDSLDQLTAFPDVVASGTFDKLWPFRDDVGALLFLSPGQGKSYRAVDGTTAWVSKTSLSGNPEPSRATLRENFYVFYPGSGNGLFRWDRVTDDMVAITMTALTLANIRGIVTAANYFLAWDSDTIFYTLREETGNAIDFTPELGQAGSFKILDLASNIVFCAHLGSGFIVYGNDNAVAAQFTGNPNNPFVLREVPGSSGIKNQDQVAWAQNVGSHFVWTTAGLQQVSAAKAENGFPEITDFLNLQTLETFDFDLGKFVKSIYDAPFAVKLEFIGLRFLAISYGPPSGSGNVQEFEEAIILDIDHKRWGKLIEKHTALFSYTFAGTIDYLTFNDLSATTFNALAATTFLELFTQDTSSPVNKYRLGLLRKNGQVLIYERSNLLGDGVCNSLFLFGRLSFTKVGVTQLSELELDCGKFDDVEIYMSFDNDPYAPSARETAMKANWSATSKAERFLCKDVVARHHIIAARGRFNLSGGIMHVDKAGDS